MWLQRYISQPMRLFIPAIVLVVAGCASTGPEVADRRAPDAEVALSKEEIDEQAILADEVLKEVLEEEQAEHDGERA